MIERIKPKQVLILKALARYKFLTYSQIIRLGIFNHTSNLSIAVSGIRERTRPMVRKIPHRVGAEAKLYLTKFGMKVLCELRPDDYNEANIHYLKRVLYTDTQNQKHRTSAISIQIELDFSCLEKGFPLLLCERDIDTIGNRRKDNNLTSKTAIEYENGRSINPDLIFIIQTPSQKELYLCELENGDDHAKSFEKTIKHAKLLLSGSANKKYNHNHAGYRTLWIFENETTMLGTMKRIQSSPFFDNVTDFFLFKPLDKINSDFWEGWLNAVGEERKLYYI